MSCPGPAGGGGRGYVLPWSCPSGLDTYCPRLPEVGAYGDGRGMVREVP